MTTKGITQPAPNSPDWDEPLNANFAAIEKAFGDATSIATASGVVPLSVAQIGHMCLRCTGALSGDLTLQVPNGTAGQWVVVNATTDAVPGTLRTVSITRGTDLNPIQIARGSARSVYADGTNQVVFADTIIIPGSDNQIIYNDAGVLAGSSTLTFDGAAVSVGGSTATTGASWSSGTATVTFSSGPTIPVGSVVSIAGVVPSGYNGSWVTTGASSTQVQFAVVTNPGTYTTAGTISYGNLNLGGSKVGGIASQELAQAGTNNTAIMTPLSTAQGITAKLNASGDAPMYACRAWVNFNGINGVVIRGSGNISGVVRESEGTYVVSFQTPMQDANYSVSLSYSNESNANGSVGPTFTAGSVRLRFQVNSTSPADKSIVSMAVFR